MLESFRGLAAHLANKCSDEMRLERKRPKLDSTGYQIGEGKPQRFSFSGSILSVTESVGFGGTAKVTGVRLRVPTACNFSDFCVGDKIIPICGPHKGECFTVSGGQGSTLSNSDESGAFIEIEIVRA